MNIRSVVAIICICVLLLPFVGKAQLPGIFIDPTAFALRGVAIPGALLTEALELKVREKQYVDSITDLQKKYLEKQDKNTALSLEYLAMMTGYAASGQVFINEVRARIYYLRLFPFSLKYGLYAMETNLNNLETKLRTLQYYLGALSRAPHFGGDGYRIIFYQEMVEELLRVNSKVVDIGNSVDNIYIVNQLIFKLTGNEK